MACSFRVRGAHGRGLTPTAIADLPIPDPRTWPVAIKEWFRSVTGGSDPLEVFIFDDGARAEMYLQDAITALGILDSIDPANWHTEGSYPLFRFDSARVGEYSRRLAACGYKANVFRPADAPARPPRRRAAVVSIASARTPKEVE